MGNLRRLVITGLIQLAAFLLLIYYAVVFVGAYYLRLALVTAAFADAVTSVYYLAATVREGREQEAESTHS